MGFNSPSILASNDEDFVYLKNYRDFERGRKIMLNEVIMWKIDLIIHRLTNYDLYFKCGWYDELSICGDM